MARNEWLTSFWALQVFVLESASYFNKQVRPLPLGLSLDFGVWSWTVKWNHGLGLEEKINAENSAKLGNPWTSKLIKEVGRQVYIPYLSFSITVEIFSFKKNPSGSQTFIISSKNNELQEDSESGIDLDIRKYSHFPDVDFTELPF